MDLAKVPLETVKTLLEDAGLELKKFLAEHVKFAAPYWTPSNVLQFTIWFSLLHFLWNNYIVYRQYLLCKRTEEPPAEICNLLTREEFKRSREYSLDKSRFSFVVSIYEQIIHQLFLFYGFYAIMWRLSGRIQSNLGYDMDNEYLHTMLFFALLTTESTLSSLPLKWYQTFVVEERHGFNKQDVPFFIKDNIKKLILSVVVTTPIVLGTLYIMKLGGDALFFYLWLFLTFVMILLQTVYPSLIAPLFDTFYPLPEGKLKSEIENLAASLKFPLSQIFVVENSKRDSHSNAYFYGIFNKRIVLFDTLIKELNPLTEEPEERDSDNDAESERLRRQPKVKGCSDDEVLAVLCHELGHWKHGHILYSMVLGLLNLLAIFAVVGTLYRNDVIFEAFGFGQERPLLMGLLLVMSVVCSPYMSLFNFFLVWQSRRFEFQADKFAKKMHRASYLRQALITLNKDNLSFPLYDWLYSAFNLSHPPIQERIEALGSLD